MPAVSAVLLAAGESTRMGRQKALLPWQGTTLIQYQLTQLAAVDSITEMVVVTGHEPEEIERLASGSPRVVIARNDAYRTGKVSSIKTGVLAISDGNHILLLAVDQPRSAAIHGTLTEHHLDAGAAITLPSHEGRRGHPVLFAPPLRAALLDIKEETQGVRALLQRHPVLEVAFDDPSVLLDLNVPADLTNAAN